ncbi:MAG: efflux RND transporter periplasmic adaptor subunit [Salinibacter sp.]|uniref:efflux RND transporter periplasmic adaptor subunit n=1 Tax=Salinibacter sp. TaxID=2065818 RepID=UPI002FC28691
MNNRLYWLLGILTVAAVGTAVYGLVSSPTEVETIRVQQREVVEVYVATGRIEAPRTSDLGVEIAGTVQRVAVEEGAEVKQGDRLVVLRPRNAKLVVEKAKARVETRRNELREVKRGPTDADLRAAESEVEQFAAQLTQAERELKRTKALFEEGGVTEQALEQARTATKEARARFKNAEARLDRLRERPLPEELRAARARLKQASVDLERARNDLAETIIRAPFDGLVLAIETKEGERVTPNETVARMADMTSAEIYAEVDEDYFGRLAPGQPATLIFPSMPEKTFTATVHRVGPEIATDRGVVGVHLAPDSLPKNTFPGLTVDANIEVARLDQALAAPIDAVVRDPMGTYVLTVEDGTTVRQAVDVRARGEPWTALEGIEAGTQVVRHAARLDIGQAVALAGGEGS